MIGIIEDSRPLLAGAALSVVAAVDVALLKPWARYLVYVLTIGFIGKLANSIYGGFHSDYYTSQFSTVDEIVAALLPSLTLVVLSLICCWLVNRHFTTLRAAASLPSATEPGADGPASSA